MGDKNTSSDINSEEPLFESPPESPLIDEASKDPQVAGSSKYPKEGESVEQGGDNKEVKSAVDIAPTSLEQNKIEVIFRNTGSAPIISRSKWAVKPSFTIADAVRFLRIQLKAKIDSSQTIFIYVNQSFAPALDQTVQNLLDCYESDKKVVLYYAITQAWG